MVENAVRFVYIYGQNVRQGELCTESPLRVAAIVVLIHLYYLYLAMVTV